jgi:hypothetical protein
MPIEQFPQRHLALREKREEEALVNVNSFAKRGAISRAREEERGPPSFHVFCTFINIDAARHRKLRDRSATSPRAERASFESAAQQNTPTICSLWS